MWKSIILTLATQCLSNPSLPSFIHAQQLLSHSRLLDNILPWGAVRASPSTSNPDYSYHWIRDAANSMQHIIDAYTDSLASNNPSTAIEFEDLLWRYASFEYTLQDIPNRSGGLGEPKFHINGSAFDGDWGRPQNDGPALRALALMRFAATYLEFGNGTIEKIEKEGLYRAELPASSSIKSDLEYIANSWKDLSFELWEEVQGQHLYTRVVQRAALLAGSTFAKRMNDIEAATYYFHIADRIHEVIQKEHWNHNSRHLLATVHWKSGPPGKTSQLDVSAILGALHTRIIPPLPAIVATYHSSPHRPNDIARFDSGEVLLTALQLAFKMYELYSINHVSFQKASEQQKQKQRLFVNEDEQLVDVAPGIGRYPEDTYDGYSTDSLGNPWFLATTAFAELSFAVADKWCTEGTIAMTEALAEAVEWILAGGLLGRVPRPHSMNPSIGSLIGKTIECHTVPDLFRDVIGNLTVAGDAYIWRVSRHVPQKAGEYGYDVGSMSEQFNRETGLMQGAIELTWSHAAFLSMARQRRITNERRSSITLDQFDLYTGLLLEVLAIPAAKLAVTKKKDVATPTATLTNGAKVSGPATVAKVLVSISGTNADWVGATDVEKTQVDKHIEEALVLHKTLSSDKKDAALATLDKALSTKVFIVGNHLTLADFFLYASLYTSVAKASKQTRIDLSNITRYFDLIQNLARQFAAITLTDKVDFDLDVLVEEIPLVAEAKKKADPAAKGAAKEAKEGAKKEKGVATPPVVAEMKPKEEKKKGGKDAASPAGSGAPKEKKGEKAPKEAKVEAEENIKAEPERLDLRVGYITSVKRHPDAESLYVEEIEIGEEKPRIVVSGLVKYMKEEDLLNRKVVLLCNLKPAKMRGIESQAMVLAATSVDGTTVELLDAPADSKAGDRCWFDSFRGTDFSQLNAKKKTWVTVQPRLKTNAFKQAVYSVSEAGVTFNNVLRTEVGEITVKSVAGASIK
ncbi:UNVERIFIED_CONTAM: Glucoamylase, intracellular sporulation-specific [Siphonaria sp. JEL0065]|nr:Glucoamylase, intracellular sporulation-specific [Siphonaria sp. JEL0065]